MTQPPSQQRPPATPAPRPDESVTGEEDPGAALDLPVAEPGVHQPVVPPAPGRMPNGPPTP